MIRILLACLLLMPLHAAAQGWPALYQVTDVAQDDVLNIRADPSANAAIIATLAPDATGVEVTRTSADGKWARINTGETSGWVSLRFLSQTQAFSWPPPSLSCFGTEPFWNASFAHSKDGHHVSVQIAGTEVQDFRFPNPRQSANNRNRYSETAWPQQGDDPLHAVFSARECSDGMSDRGYGIAVDLLLPTGRDWSHYSGCCSVSP